MVSFDMLNVLLYSALVRVAFRSPHQLLHHFSLLAVPVIGTRYETYPGTHCCICSDLTGFSVIQTHYREIISLNAE